MAPLRETEAVTGKTAGHFAGRDATQERAALLAAAMADLEQQTAARERAEAALRESETHFRLYYENNPLPMWVYDLETLRFLTVNEAAIHQYGYSRAEFLALTLADIRPPAERPALLAKLAPAGEGFDSAGVWRHRKKDGTIISVEITAHSLTFAGRPAKLVLANDITERLQTEEKLRQLVRALKVISECGEALVRATDENQLLEQICRLIVGEGGYRLAWVGFRELDAAQTVRPVAQAGYADGYLETVKVTWADSERGRGPAGTAIRTGQPAMVRHIATDASFAPWRQEAAKRGYASVIGLPLRTAGGTLGALTIYAVEPDAFGAPEVHLLTELADDLVYGIETLRSRAALQEAQTRLQLAIQASNVGFWEWDIRTDALYVSPEWQRQLGYSAEQAPRQFAALTNWLHPDDAQWIEGVLRQYLAQPWPDFETEFRLRHSDGSYRWILMRAALVHDAEGRPLRMLGSHVDITERKGAEEYLKRSEESLRALASHLQTVREEQNIRIAREIHDELGQALTGLKIDLAWLDRRLARAGPPKALAELRGKIAAMSAQINATIQAVRRIGTELRPGVLDDLGLVAAIEWQAQEFQGRTGIRCRLNQQVASVALDKPRATAVFRIFQEILTNITRHAQASQVDISLTTQGERLQLEVQDNGRGITGRELADTQALGLLGMRERALAVGGTVEVHGAPQHGTTVRVQVPLGNLAA